MAPKKNPRKILMRKKKRCRNFSVQVGPQCFKWPKKFALPSKLHAIITWQEQPTRGMEEIYDRSGNEINCANCLLCKGIAREPVEVPCCGAWLCSICYLLCAEKNPPKPMATILKYRYIPQPDFPLPHYVMKCIHCTQNYCFHDVLYYDEIPDDRKAGYLKLKVTCPNQCGLIGSPEQIVKHQTFYCSKRKIKCPNYLCAEPPNEIAKIREHFEICQLKRYYCRTCGWPVALIEKDQHTCIKKLTEIITKIQYAQNFDDFRTTRALKLCFRSKAYVQNVINNVFPGRDWWSIN